MTNNLKGVNLVGYSKAETGVGQSCRLAANVLQKSNVPFGIIDFTKGNPARMQDLSWVHKEIKSPIYNTNIFHINADQMPLAFKELGQSVFSGRYNIGYWHWELPEFPDQWSNSFKLVNEVWVPSTFVFNAITKKSPVPVVKIPHGIEVNVPKHINRRAFGLPQNHFLFLSMYDILSFQERKNPNAVIEAFKRAFPRKNIPVGLVLKVNNSNKHPEQLAQLKREIQGLNVILIERTLERNEINALLNVCDSYVSLHRSEGFGLPLAEAMYLGKPVIGTNWSANTDFMTNKNSCLVNYELKKLQNNFGPYEDYQFWAEPDIQHAAQLMLKVISHRDWSKAVGLQGQKTIRNHFSPLAVGNHVKARLMKLGLL